MLTSQLRWRLPVWYRSVFTTSHHITSHHITSHHITSHHITSHHITSCHVTPHHTHAVSVMHQLLRQVACLSSTPSLRHTSEMSVKHHANLCSAQDGLWRYHKHQTYDVTLLSFLFYTRGVATISGTKVISGTITYETAETHVSEELKTFCDKTFQTNSYNWCGPFSEGNNRTKR